MIDLPVWPDGTEPAFDCYSLTAVGESAWTSPYADFPIVRFTPGAPPRWWRNALAGIQALAVSGRHALLAGGYGRDATRLALVRCDDPGDGEPIMVLATGELPLRPVERKDGWPHFWETPCLLTGIGDTIHLIDNGRWYRWSVEQVRTAVG